MEVQTETLNLDEEKVDVPKETFTDMDESLVVETSAEDIQSEPEVQPFEIPDKFKGKTAEEIAKAYVELEKLKGKEVKKGNEDGEDKPEGDTEEKQEVKEDPVAEGPMTIEQYQETWSKQGGALSDRQWEELNKQTGIPMDTLKAWEAYVAADTTANLDNHDKAIYEASGGEDKYNEMMDWAEANLNDEQIDALNAQLDSPQFYEQGLKILKASIQAAEGVEPSVSPVLSNTAEIGGDEFHSDKEYLDAMNHPEYGMGGKYDREFDAKLMRYMKRSGQS